MYAKSPRSTVKDRVANSTLRGVYRREELSRLGTLWFKGKGLQSESEIKQVMGLIMSDDEKTYLVGTVKWFNSAKAFGFIELPGGGLDVFVHANQLHKSGIDRALKEGERVKFLTAKGPKGSFAVEITIVEPEA